MLFSTSLATLGVLAVASSASPLNARDDTCTFKVNCAHSYGGGGVGMPPLDQIMCLTAVTSSNGDVVYSDRNSYNPSATNTVTAADWHGSADVVIEAGFSGGDNQLRGTWAFNGQTNSFEGHNSIDSGTVTVSQSEYTWDLPCTP
ncbi:uncharacterized protein B0I36DRAFT_368088 [Microdochium trichocladiopsis]|uniref:Secreted protein n=1 Tax=Microdochium trichocladiopsis TaxID=1682393 RepID=A0A9P8XVE0_9PEZI|nr:uncharacterized protein B0I36DRAFT_368088 [Microdochium trichocladiopsis]KAH7018036.1 hypothetical protein B0I36DRAFT_368088 [Microdochium trichocladiopsis]